MHRRLTDLPISAARLARVPLAPISLAGVAALTALTAPAAAHPTDPADEPSGRPRLADVADSAESRGDDAGFLREMGEVLSWQGIAAAAYQFQLGDGDDPNAGAITIRPEIDFAPSDVDLFHVVFALAGGNAINDASPFAVAPWSADLEDDLRDVNGSGRDFIQTAWYRRDFLRDETGVFAVTAGLIDSTTWLDVNAFANDEYTQFLNETFVNAPLGFFPSYAPGAAVEWSNGDWSANGVVMRVAENDDGNDFLFAGAQLGRHFETAGGETNVHLTASWASDDFRNAADTTDEGRLALIASGDAEVGSNFGVWARLGWQDDAAAVTHEWMLSGGVTMSGAAWGRDHDEAGVGLAWLEGGNAGIDSTMVAEGYVNFGLFADLHLTLDAQYIDEETTGGGTTDAVILGGRVVLEF